MTKIDYIFWLVKEVSLMQKISMAMMILISMSGCSFFKNSDSYLGIVYPDKSNLTEHRIIGEYSTLNECLKAVNASVSSEGSYECGKNCDRSKMPMVCEETLGNEK